jgi:hypothetical protein
MRPDNRESQGWDSAPRQHKRQASGTHNAVLWSWLPRAATQEGKELKRAGCTPRDQPNISHCAHQGHFASAQRICSSVAIVSYRARLACLHSGAAAPLTNQDVSRAKPNGRGHDRYQQQNDGRDGVPVVIELPIP